MSLGCRASVYRKVVSSLRPNEFARPPVNEKRKERKRQGTGLGLGSVRNRLTPILPFERVSEGSDRVCGRVREFEVVG